MTQIHLHASSQTFACESCGHLNVVPVSEVPLKTSGKSNAAELSSEHEILEQVDLPPAFDTQNKPQRTVSQAADNDDDLNALAAANAAKDGKLEQHLDELHMHQGQTHGTHHPMSRRSSHLHPSGSIPHKSSILSRSSSDARDLAEDQQLPQQSGIAQPHPPASHLANPSQGSGCLQHSLHSARSRDLGSLPGSRTNSGALGGSEVGPGVVTLKGPTEVILEQIQRSTGSGHARNPSNSPMSKHSEAAKLANAAVIVCNWAMLQQVFWCVQCFEDQDWHLVLSSACRNALDITLPALHCFEVTSCQYICQCML